jgi:hypothetical protein
MCPKEEIRDEETCAYGNRDVCRCCYRSSDFHKRVGRCGGEGRTIMRKLVLVAGFFGILALFVVVPVGVAGQPVTVPLNPPPPSFETCKTVGDGVICDGSRVLSYGPNDSGIVCGSGPSTFDPIDQGLDYQHAIRFYDTNGDLLQRVKFDHNVGAFSNPLTGASIPYNQASKETDVLAVPGDFGSATMTFTGSINFTVPGMGLVFQNAGRQVVDANGDTLTSAGPQDFNDYFSGNTSVADELCAALGA